MEYAHITITGGESVPICDYSTKINKYAHQMPRQNNLCPDTNDSQNNGLQNGV